MASSKPKPEKVTIQAHLDLTVSTEVLASNLEEALEKARYLKEGAFVDITGEYLDGSMEITGVYK